MSADAKSLLLEIGCEEVPARMLPGAAADFAGLVAAILDRAGLAHGAPRLFWTPRRFAALFGRHLLFQFRQPSILKFRQAI